MKIYTYTAPNLVRLQIKKQSEIVEYINLIDTNIEEVEGWIKKLIESQNISPFQSGKFTMINIRESIAGNNGKSKNLSFKGLSPKETHDLIIRNIP